MSDDIFGASRDAQTEAVAQIVFTATGVPGRVAGELLVDGERGPGPAATARSEAGPLTRFMFPALNPSSRPDYPPLTEDGGPVGHHDDRPPPTTTPRPPRPSPGDDHQQHDGVASGADYPKKMAATSSYMLRSRVRVRPSARRSGARSMRLSR